MSSKKHQSAIESNNAFMVKIEDLVKEILIQNGMPYYRLDSDMESAEGGQYMPVIRIVTYFEDTVGKISDILQAEFDVTARPPDKRRQGGTFPSKNIHYQAGLKANRQGLTEYRRSADKKFEIQVCSMLSDAWLGIEKELSYDVANMSDEIKRDFYRVGALLEMADIEFLKIRTLLNQGGRGTAGQQAPMPQQTNTTFSEHLRAVAMPADELKPSYEAHAYMIQKGTQNAAQNVPEQQTQYAANNGTEQQQYAQQPAPVNNMGAMAPQVVNTVPENIQPQGASYQDMYNNAAAEAANMANSYAAPAMANAAQNWQQPAQPPQQQYTQPQQQYAQPVQPQYAQPQQQAAPQSQAYVQPQAPQPQPPAPAQQPYMQPPIYNQPAQPQAPQQQYAAPAPPPANAAGNIAAGAAGGVIGTEILEKAMEIIREHGAPEKVVPFYEDQPQKEAVAAPFDENAQMTDATLKDYVLKSKLVKEVDMQIAERAGAKLNPEVDIEGDVDRLRFLRVHSLMQLHEKIQDNSNDIVAFAEKWIGKDNGGSFDSGICLFYLEYLLVGKKNDPAFAVEYVVKFISDNDYSARYIIPTYNSIRSTDTAPASHAHLTLK